MRFKSNRTDFYRRLLSPPDAVAVVRGDAENSSIGGTVSFYQTEWGVLISVNITGLPVFDQPCKNGIFAFHIHSGNSCSGNGSDPFANAGTHYNPGGCLHPYHAGDMPPLFQAGYRAFLAFLKDEFTVNEIIGKTVIIHDRPDDFTTQPSGNAGNKIACGIIEKVRRW